MSELATRLIAEAQADCASRLEAIEAHAGRIEEAEALAATLRSKGLDVTAYGYSSPAWFKGPAKLITWVSSQSADAEALLIALRDAELVISDITNDNGTAYLHLQGLENRLHISDSTRKGVLAALRVSLGSLAQPAKEPAHG